MKSSPLNTITDATKKLLGYEYQKYVALEMCMDAKENTSIYIECYGDVASDKMSVEVKHHEGNKTLGDSHIDFWKTLYNWVSNSQLYLGFDRLLLHTTSKVKSSSIFHCWNDLSSTDKLTRIRSVKTTETIKEFYEFVLQFAEDHQKSMLAILGRIEIHHSQHEIKHYVKLIENKGMMKTVEQQWRTTVLDRLFGYITKQAIENCRLWKVDVNDFTRAFRALTREFAKDDVPFPYVGKTEVSVIDYGYRFVKEIQGIQCSNFKMTRAIQDFLRANESAARLVSLTPELCIQIQQFDDSLEDIIVDKKDSAISKARDDDAGEGDLLPYSRSLYDQCINHPLQSLRGVQKIEPYFQTGRMHNVVEDGDFTWKIEIEDLYEA